MWGGECSAASLVRPALQDKSKDTVWMSIQRCDWGSTIANGTEEKRIAGLVGWSRSDLTVAAHPGNHSVNCLQCTLCTIAVCLARAGYPSIELSHRQHSVLYLCCHLLECSPSATEILGRKEETEGGDQVILVVRR